jgi:hypothetical protein
VRHVPRPVVALLIRLLEKDPSHRPHARRIAGNPGGNQQSARRSASNSPFGEDPNLAVNNANSETRRKDLSRQTYR